MYCVESNAYFLNLFEYYALHEEMPDLCNGLVNPASSSSK